MATYFLAHGESLEDGEMTFVLRPMRADDARSYAEIMNASDASSVDFPFPRIRPPLTGPALARFTQIDREREMAFVAAVENGTRDELVGEVRIIVFPESDATEVTIFVRPHRRRGGIGRALLLKMIRHCVERGFSESIGQVAPENERMFAFAREVGFDLCRASEAGVVVAHLKPSRSTRPVDSTTPPDPSGADTATAMRGSAIEMNASPLLRRAPGVSRASGRSAYEGLEAHK